MFALHMEITLQLSLVFCHHYDVFSITLFICSVQLRFDGVVITSYFGTFELRMEIT